MKRYLQTMMLLLVGLALCQCKPNQAKFTMEQMYQAFQQPSSEYHPFVRWWWNGDKVEADELVRELHLLKEAGIGGVEINPIAFPPYCDSLDNVLS